MKFISIGAGEAVFVCDHNVPYIFDVKCEKCAIKEDILTRHAHESSEVRLCDSGSFKWEEIK